jgi:mRNA interferase MazF
MDNGFSDRQIRRGEVYWCEFMYGVGGEQIGNRPVVIVSNDKCNEFSMTVTVVPVTSAVKKKLPTHAIIRATSKTSVALAEQVCTVDKLRIGTYINSCTENEMSWIDKCLKIQLGIYDPECHDAKADDENGIKIINRGYKYFRQTCSCCGSLYQYTTAHITEDKKATVCPECGFENAHSALCGVEVVEA